MKIILPLIGLICMLSTHANANIDSLRKTVHTDQDVMNRVSAAKRAFFHFRSDNVDSSMYYVNYLKRIYHYTGYEPALLEHYVYKSDVEVVNLRFIQASESLHELVNLCDHDTLWDYKAYALRNLSQAYVSLQDYESALQFADSCRAVSERNGSDGWVADAYSSMATAYQHMGEFEKSNEYNLRALATYRSSDSKRSQIRVHNNMGITYKKAGEFDNAIFAYQKVIPLAIEIGSTESLFRVYNNIGNLNREGGFFRIAHKYYLKCDSIAKSTSETLPLDVHTAYASGITDTYMALGKAQKAQEYYAIYRTLEDSLDRKIVESTKDKMENQLTLTEAENRLSLRTAELNEARKESEILVLENKNQWTMSVAIALSAIIGIAILFWFLRRQVQISKEKEKSRERAEVALKKSLDEKIELEQKIRQKSDEMTNLALSIKNKNEILDQLVTEMEKTAEDSNLNLRLNGIYRSVKDLIQIDRDRDLLELYVSDIHQDFGIKLKEIASNLTEKEVKISGLIRLGMSSKEISVLLNISPGSVDTYRYNIRKKLGIEKSTSLSNVLAKI